MSIFNSINNNDDENNNNDKPVPLLDGSSSYSSPPNNKSNKGKYTIILGVGVIAVLITTVIYYQQYQQREAYLDQEIKRLVSDFKSQFAHLERQGQAGYGIMFNVLETPKIQNLMKDYVRAVADNKPYDERLDKWQILASEMANMYFKAYLQENPNASIFERAIINQILKSLSIGR